MRAAFLALFLALWAGNAVAHAVLLDTTPGDGARLTAPPTPKASVRSRKARTATDAVRQSSAAIDGAGAGAIASPIAKGNVPAMGCVSAEATRHAT